MKKFLLLLWIGLFNATALKRTFEGYEVYKIIPKTENDVRFIKDLQRNRIGELWEDQVQVNYEARVMVPPQNLHMFLERVNAANVYAHRLISDLQSVVDDQLLPKDLDLRIRGENISFFSMTWDRYHDLTEINNWLDEVAANYPSFVKIVNIGRTFENREIKGIVINYKPNRENKLIGMLEGTLHAREWISPAVVNWIIKEFLTSRDPVVRSIAENIEWHIFPVVNPDGYVYTFTTNRMWRKNRNTLNFTSCATSGVDDDMSNGVDLNRNFDFAWMTVGVSTDPCTNIFPGSSPASELETQAIVNYVRSIQNQGRFIYYYSFHSFSQLIIVPYSNVTAADVLQVGNYGDMYEIAARGSAKAHERFSKVYRYGIADEILYLMSGSSFDWVKQETDVALSYLIELRDSGEFGFLLPASQIIPNSLEIMDALVEMDRVTRQLEVVNYKQHKVYKVTPKTDSEVQILTELKDSNEYLFWLEYVKKDVDMKIMVDPVKQYQFESLMADVGIKSELVVKDVQSLIEEQLQRPAMRNAQDYNWEYYQSWEEVEEWMVNMVARYPNVASIVTAGRSAEGRDIRGVKIDFKKRERPVIGMIESTLHAREWITTATATWMINELLTSSDPGIRELADNVEWHIFPVTNPDGFIYTFTNNRMWRKNRSTASFKNCTHRNVPDDMSNGVDLNRNFGFLWNTIGASDDACDIVYAGPTAFSEPETMAIVNYVKGLQRRGNMVYYISLHSYSQMILVPYSHVGGADVVTVPNYGDMFEIATRAAVKLQARHNTTYRVGTSLDILYPVTGSGFDWAKGGANVPISLLYELRDVGEFGFLLPARFIRPNNEEFMDSIVEIDKVTRALGYYHINSSSVLKISSILVFFAIFLQL
ncbi:unnamed protein product [Leptosia nina]|uniref:Peptidase M14 domain-containing protein n=1 Tax=Leptosia nina TaxID=320188 RepID=A0AAV1JLS1_9NEOP